MKVLLVGPTWLTTLESLLKATGKVEVVLVDGKDSLSALLEHEPTHVMVEWRGDDKKADAENQVLLTNAQMLGVKRIVFFSWLSVAKAPEYMKDSFIRLPISAHEVISVLEGE